MSLLKQFNKLCRIKSLPFSRHLSTTSVICDNNKVLDHIHDNNNKETHFGFTTVKENEKAQKGLCIILYVLHYIIYPFFYSS